MTTYEYRCQECGAQIVTTGRLEDVDPLGQWQHWEADEVNALLPDGDLCYGRIRRTWSFGVAWPADQRGHD